jgi:hypothetical protein
VRGDVPTRAQEVRDVIVRATTSWSATTSGSSSRSPVTRTSRRRPQSLCCGDSVFIVSARSRSVRGDAAGCRLLGLAGCGWREVLVGPQVGLLLAQIVVAAEEAEPAELPVDVVEVAELAVDVEVEQYLGAGPHRLDADLSSPSSENSPSVTISVPVG